MQHEEEIENMQRRGQQPSLSNPYTMVTGLYNDDRLNTTVRSIRRIPVKCVEGSRGSQSLFLGSRGRGKGAQGGMIVDPIVKMKVNVCERSSPVEHLVCHLQTWKI